MANFEDSEIISKISKIRTTASLAMAGPEDRQERFVYVHCAKQT